MMGGAIGIAARRTGTAIRVTGVAHNQNTIQGALQKGAADEATVDLMAGVRDADLVVLCVPVRTILEATAAIIPVLRDDAVITDIGSTKGYIVREAEALLARMKARIHFVGSHPVTGSEKKGIDAAGLVQLDGAPCVVTPTARTDPEAYHKVEEFWKGLGLKTLRLSPEEHDAVLARSSHLPHIVAAALVTLQSSRSLDISGPGLRDMTRLAGGEPAMWTDIADQNAHEVSKALREFGQQALELSEEIAQMVQRGTPGAEAARERLFRFLADARQRHRDRFVAHKAAEAAGTGDAEAAAREVALPPLGQ
jgi:prephenate dehydrogenase